METRESPLDGNDLMEMFDRPPGPWIKLSITYLENEAIEGRLGKDDTEKLAEAHVEEHKLSCVGILSFRRLPPSR